MCNLSEWRCQKLFSNRGQGYSRECSGEYSVALLDREKLQALRAQIWLGVRLPEEAVLEDDHCATLLLRGSAH